MEDDKYQELIQTLSFFVENSIPEELMIEQIGENYLDINNNNYLHYLANYTFKEFCFFKYNPKNNEIINSKRYKSLLNEYLKAINKFTSILASLNYSISQENIFEQSPLELCLFKKNYYMASEFIKYIDDYDLLIQKNPFNIIFFNNCIENENMSFILTLLQTFISLPEYRQESFKLYLLRPLDETGSITPLISVIKDYNKFIYHKFNQLLKENIIEYLTKGNDNKYIILPDEKIKNEIKAKAILQLNEFCMVNFNNLITSFLSLGANINCIENYSSGKNISGIMYLMAYPNIPNFIEFINENHINLNYQDYFGRTPLIHLINNKYNISNIDNSIYDEVFHILINYKESGHLSKRDNNGISAFLLCLLNRFYDNAKAIYNEHLDTLLSEFNLDFLLFLIITMENKEFDKLFLLTIKEEFMSEINFDFLDNINKRTLFHYFFMFYSDDSLDTYIKILDIIIDFNIDYNKKDIFGRNCLFYLFIDFFGDPKGSNDPFKILNYCLKKNIFKVSPNDKDILGNNLFYYSIQCGFLESVNLLLEYGAKLDDSPNKDGNNIYSLALMANDELFLYLNNIGKISNILDQKLFIMSSNYDCFMNENNNKDFSFKNEIKLNMYNFFHDPELILSQSNKIENQIIIEENNKIKDKSLIEKSEEETFKENYENQFSMLDLLNEEQRDVVNTYYKTNFDFKFENPLKKSVFNIKNKNIMIFIEVLKDPINFINRINSPKKCIFSASLFDYCVKFEKINIIEKNNDIITICKYYSECGKSKELVTNLNEIITEYKDDKDLINFKNKEGQNIFHILAMSNQVQDENIDLIYNRLSSIKLDDYDLFDNYGNSPMYYACSKFNKKYIKIFGKYNFNQDNNEDMNIDLFFEQKNNITPLEILYQNLNKEDNDLLSLIIKIAFKSSIGNILYLIKYLVDKYKSNLKNIFLKSYNVNLLDSQYLNKIIGLYQYLLYELKYSIKECDEDGNDPFMLCIIKNNFDFLFDILLPEKRKKKLKINFQNNKGQSLIHLIVQSDLINKKEMLLQMLKEGFSFNMKDNKGLFPIDYAYLNNEKEIVEILKKKYMSKDIPIELNLLFNFYEDSDILFKEAISDSSKFQQCDDLFGLVYSQFKYYKDGIHKVHIDKEYIPYNASLISGNLIEDDDNINKFIIQILYNVQNKNFIVATLENDIHFDEFTFNNSEEAENKFKEIFMTKTNNNWDTIKKDKNKFKTDYNKYYYFNYDYSKENDIYDYLKITIKNLNIKKNLKYDDNHKIRDFIYYLARKAYNNRFNIEESNDINSDKSKNYIEINTRKIIKKYKFKAMKDSMIILDKLGNLIEDKNNSNEYNLKRIKFLKHSYLSLIPYSIHNNNEDILNTTEEINEEKGRITTFYFIENILKIFLGAIKYLDAFHPLDYIIQSIGCNIIELNDCEEKYYIEEFLKTTGAEEITNIFKITESINDKNFNPNKSIDRYIFCHGTKSENILGILSEGLKISPVQAASTGKKFGEGIYLSDSFSISSYYSKNKLSDSGKEYILLVEAALDNNGFDQVEGFNVNKKKAFVTIDGYAILDGSKSRGGIIVIKNPMNVRVKYIVEI